MYTTPSTGRGRNATRNLFLSKCSISAHPSARVTIELPGRPPMEGALLGWDDYTLVLRSAAGRVSLIWQAPGMRVVPLEQGG